MSNPIRPWFRLSSIARPTAQGSTEPAPQPRSAAPRGPAAVVRPVIVAPPPPPPPPPPSSPPKREATPPPPPPPPREQTPPPRAPSPQRRAVVIPSPTPPPPPRPSAQLSPPRPQPQPQLLKSPPPKSPTSPTKEVKEAFVRIGDPQRKPISSPEYPPSRSVKPEPRTPPEAPKPKAPSPKLSPYSLPPSQLRSSHEDDVTTQKKVLITEKSSQVHQQKEHHQQHNHSKVSKKIPPSDSEDMGARVITIAGDNKGAVMEIVRGDPKYITKTGKSRVLNSGGGSSSSSDEGEGKKTKNKGNVKNPNSTLPLKAFMNSNVQMINNSIVYNATATHHDPGIHLSLVRTPGKGFHVKEHGNGYVS